MSSINATISSYTALSGPIVTVMAMVWAPAVKYRYAGSSPAFNVLFVYFPVLVPLKDKASHSANGTVPSISILR